MKQEQETHLQQMQQKIELYLSDASEDDRQEYLYRLADWSYGEAELIDMKNE